VISGTLIIFSAILMLLSWVTLWLNYQHMPPDLT